MPAETLRKWIRQAAVDEGAAPGVTSAESAEIRELRRKNRGLEQTIEILQGAGRFLRAGVRPATVLICQFIAFRRAKINLLAPALAPHSSEP